MLAFVTDRNTLFFCSVVFTSHSLCSFFLNDIALFVPSLLRRIWTTKNYDVDDDDSTSAPVCVCRHTIVDNSNWKLRLKRKDNQHRRNQEDHCRLCIPTQTRKNWNKASADHHSQHSPRNTASPITIALPLVTFRAYIHQISVAGRVSRPRHQPFICCRISTLCRTDLERSLKSRSQRTEQRRSKIA